MFCSSYLLFNLYNFRLGKKLAEQQIQALTKTLNENNQILMQNCQNLDINSRVVSDSGKAIAHTLESLDPSLDREMDSGYKKKSKEIECWGCKQKGHSQITLQKNYM